jgi:hypothetical protein
MYSSILDEEVHVADVEGAASSLSVYAYSPGRRRKKNPSRSISAMVLACGVFAQWQRCAVCARIGNGIGLTLAG